VDGAHPGGDPRRRRLAIAGGSTILKVPAVVPTAHPSAPVGFRHISAPGVELDVPRGWIDVTAWAPSSPEKRNVAYLIDGVADCPGPVRTAGPGDTAATAPCIDEAGSTQDTLAFIVVEELDPSAVGPRPSGTVMSIGGYLPRIGRYPDLTTAAGRPVTSRDPVSAGTR
jgi:hypothetical protein